MQVAVTVTVLRCECEMLEQTSSALSSCDVSTLPAQIRAMGASDCCNVASGENHRDRSIQLTAVALHPDVQAQACAFVSGSPA